MRHEPDVVDLTELELRPAPEADQIEGLLQARVAPAPDAAEPGVRAPGPIDAVRFVALLLVGLLAPLVVLQVALTLPVGRPVQGAVVVAGWVALGVAARRYETTMRRRRR